MQEGLLSSLSLNELVLWNLHMLGWSPWRPDTYSLQDGDASHCSAVDDQCLLGLGLTQD